MAKKDKKEKKKSTAASSSYDAKDIYVLEGLEPVRKRPGMYIGSTGADGLHHLIWEVVDNSIDEAMAGFARNVTVELLPDNSVAVTDDGRGIPVDVHVQTKKSALETVLTTLHAGGKFGGDSYKVSGGLHGVGVSVVNALSEKLRVEVSREGGLFMQEYKRGAPLAKVKKIGTSKGTGTKVIFTPDKEIFSALEFNASRILDHLRQQAYLTAGVRINVLDRRETPPKFYGFCFEGGVKSFVKYLAQDEKPLQEDVFYIHKESDAIDVEVAFQYVDDMETRELSFANNIYTPDGGMHLTGFRSAMTRSINSYARAENYLKDKDENLTADDAREGLVAVVSVKLPEPQFEGQTKARLGTPAARPAVESVVNEALKEFMEKRPQEARRMVEKMLLAAKARLAAKAAKETVLRKGALEGLTLPGKLADCSSRLAAESELFIVEGDSAGGCFDGETKVALTDGRSISFKELVREHAEGKENFCYTIGSDGKIQVAPILHPRVTKKNAEIVKVVLDSGEEITCTPDHKFMLRDGSYKEAGTLTPHDSLMPLYRKYSEIGGRVTIAGYEMVFQPRGNWWEFTHLLSDRYNLAHSVYVESDGSHRHHKDFNKRNNNPDNLVRMTREGHMEFHRRQLEKTMHRPDVKEKIKAIHAPPEFRAKISTAMSKPEMRAMLSARAKTQWANFGYKEFMTRSFLKFYRSNAEYRATNSRILREAQKRYWSVPANVKKQAERVTKYFLRHPEKRLTLSLQAKKQWSDPELLQKRSKLTREQWTTEFRAKRKSTYNQTYLNKALTVLRSIFEASKTLDFAAYNELRARTNDKSLLRPETIVARFFGGSEEKLRQAVMHYNHKVKAVIPLSGKIDVYDIEVPETHNFALASGVFVHNSAKSGRDRRTQAILPVKGKILNVEKTRLDKMLANAEIRSLIIAMGTAISDSFDLAKIRYHKIILMSDADVDGAHIRTLFLTLFYRYFPQIIEQGYLYIAQPPLYRLQRGKDVRYAYNDEEKGRLVKEMTTKKENPEKLRRGADNQQDQEGEKSEEVVAEAASEGGEKVAGVSIQRYKGLGEMNPDQLWDTTMNPEKRFLGQVTVGDAIKADKLFNILMGDVVEPRKQFIQAHAASVQNLDI